MTEILFNPTLVDERKKEIEKLLLKKEFNEPHTWIGTSGSFAKEGVSKWAALSNRALKTSAESVNMHLNATSSDIWLNPLPKFHVGGLGIQIRGELAGAEVIDFLKISPKWCPDQFLKALHKTKATLTALVPTQVYDFVVKDYPAPPHLRAAIIGGGALDEALYLRARNLGWNVLPSYGMTESASQVATASLDSLNVNQFPALKLLTHVEVASESGILKIKSPSLLTTYGIIENGEVTFHDPKQADVFTTSDRGVLDGNFLTILGRVDDIIKILGENVDISKLQKKVDAWKITLLLQGDFYLAPIPDIRAGNALCLFYTQVTEEDVKSLIALFNQNVFPFERITKSEKREFLPKTALGKIERKKILI